MTDRRKFLSGLLASTALCGLRPAQAMLTVNQLHGFNVGGGGPVAMSFTDNAANQSDLSTYTFSTRSFGTAAADRIIVVGIVARRAAAATLDSVTIGGVTATKTTGVINSGGGAATIADIWQAPVPTGTTGDVVVTFNTAMARCAVVIYRMVGASSTASNTQTSTATDPSVSLNVPANGAAMGVAHSVDGSTTTWTGLTEDVDTTASLESTVYTSAHDNFTAQQTGLTVTANFSAGTSPAGAFASWGPS
jgi:hypothetical protein